MDKEEKINPNLSFRDIGERAAKRHADVLKSAGRKPDKHVTPKNIEDRLNRLSPKQHAAFDRLSTEDQDKLAVTSAYGKGDLLGKMLDTKSPDQMIDNLAKKRYEPETVKELKKEKLGNKKGSNFPAV